MEELKSSRPQRKQTPKEANQDAGSREDVDQAFQFVASHIYLMTLVDLFLCSMIKTIKTESFSFCRWHYCSTHGAAFTEQPPSEAEKALFPAGIGVDPKRIVNHLKQVKLYKDPILELGDCAEWYRG